MIRVEVKFDGAFSNARNYILDSASNQIILRILIWVLGGREVSARTTRNCKIKNFPRSQMGHVIPRKVNAKSRKYEIFSFSSENMCNQVDLIKLLFFS